MIIKGKVGIGRSDIVRGKYSSEFFALGYLGKVMDMEVKYAETFTVAEVGSEFSSINIEESYTPILLTFNPNCRFVLDANMKRAKLDYDAPTVSMTVMESVDQEDCKCTKMTYLGRFGARSARVGRVKLEGHYGSARITQ